MAIAVGAYQYSNPQPSGASPYTTTGITTAASGSSFLVVTFITGYGYTSPATVTGDNKGNTYTQLGSNQSIAGTQMAVYFATGSGGSGHTLTIGGGFSSIFTLSVHFVEITGGTATSPVDVQTITTDTTSPWNAQVTTTVANDLVLAFIANDGGTSPNYSASGWTALNTWATANSAGGYKSAASAGNYDPAWTAGAGTNAALATVAIKEALTSATGTLAVTEAADSLAASGAIAVTGTLSKTESADLLAASGTVPIGGTLAITESADSLVTSGTVTTTIAVGAYRYANPQPMGGATYTTTGITTAVSGSSFLVVLFAGQYQGTATLSGLTDSKSNTYVQLGTTQTTAGLAMNVYLCTNGTGGSAHTVTAVLGNSYGLSIHFVEITNGAASSIVDIQTLGIDNAQPWDAQVTTTNANDLLLSFVFADVGTPPPALSPNYSASGWTALNTWGSDFSAGAYKYVTSVNTYNPAWTATTGNNAVLATVALRQASSTLAVTESPDTLAASGVAAVNGILSKTESADTLSFSGSTAVTGTLAKTESADSLAASGVIPVRGTLVKTESADVLSGTTISTTLTYINFDDGVLQPAGWAIGGQNGGTMSVSANTALNYNGSAGSLKGTIPIAQNICNYAEYFVPPNTEELYFDYWIKMPAAKRGLKHLKIFGGLSTYDGGPSYAGTTFSLDYTGANGDYGDMYQVSFGDGSTPANDTQNVINFDGSNPEYIGRSYGTAVVQTPQYSRWASSNWGTDWHHFKIQVKFNSGTTALNEVPDGAYYVEIDNVVYVNATGLYNRHFSNPPISRFSFYDYTDTNEAFELWLDEIRITTGGFLSDTRNGTVTNATTSGSLVKTESADNLFATGASAVWSIITPVQTPNWTNIL